MLLDLIKKDVNIILSRQRKNEEHFPFKLRGELEVFGYRNGKLFHYEKADNTIMLWAKHAVMHLMTGDVFAPYGYMRNVGIASHDDGSTGDTKVNDDGTLISGYQYFGDPDFPGTNEWWSASQFPGDSYAYFPTKMLFGTGFEFTTWSDIYTVTGDSTYYTEYIADGWDSSTFNSNVYGGDNWYSNDFDATGDTLTPNRTMNDVYSAALTTPVITDTNFGIPGAIKTGEYYNEAGDSAKIESIAGNYYSVKAYRGIGLPAFIYATRETRFYQQGAEILLSYDGQIENKITYTVTMPEQTGLNAGIFYPYNGYNIKVAGLFCDARFFLKNTVPANDAASDDSGGYEHHNYEKMRGGMLYASRYVAPVTKDFSTSLTFRWSIYL